jgi:hypothetical protein
MPDYSSRDPNDPKTIYDWAGESLPDVGNVLQGIFNLEGQLNPQQAGQMSSDYQNILSGFLPGYTETARGIGEADIGLDEAKRRSMGEFFTGGEYGDLLGGMAAGDPGGAGAISDLRGQSEMLGEATRGVIEGAGVLNPRERANIEDRARAASEARGRGYDNSAIAGEIGDVIEAERLDRGRDLTTAANLMGAQSGVAGTTNALQNQFVSQFLGADQSIMPGLGTAQSMMGTAGDVGLDPGQIFNIAGAQAQNELGLEMSREEADAIREAGYYSAASPFISSAVGGISDWMAKIFGPQQQP